MYCYRKVKRTRREKKRGKTTGMKWKTGVCTGVFSGGKLWCSAFFGVLVVGDSQRRHKHVRTRQHFSDDVFKPATLCPGFFSRGWSQEHRHETRPFFSRPFKRHTQKGDLAQASRLPAEGVHPLTHRQQQAHESKKNTKRETQS